jgi:hypothetical protein
MADIAQIGFAADTTALARAEQQLNRLPPAAKAAEKAANDTAGALGNVAKASDAATDATEKQVRSLLKSTQQQQATAKVAAVAAGAANANVVAINKQTAANDNLEKSQRQLGFATKNLGFQLVDVTQGLIGGQSVFQIFAQQSGQIAQIIATTPGGLGALMKELSKAISGVFTVSRLAVVGVAGLGAAFLFAANSVVQSSKALDDLSRATDETIPKLRALQQATAIKGIDPDSFNEGIKSFANSVFDANKNLGSLKGLMIANGQSAKDLQGYLEKVADLVARATGDIQKQRILREAGLPSDAAWVRFMEQGGAAIRIAMGNTVEFNNAAERNLIKKAREFDEAWARATTSIANNFKSAIINIVNAMSSVQIPDWMVKLGKLAGGAASGIPVIGALAGAGSQAASLFGANKPSFADRFSGEGANPAAGNQALASGLNKKANIVEPKTQAELLAANQQAQSRISLLGELATVEEKVRLKELELNAAALQGIGVSKERQQQIINATRAQEEQNRVMQLAQIGIYDEAQARKAATDTLQMWIDKGLVNKNNVEQMAAAQLVLAESIRRTKDAAELAAAPLKQLKQLEQDASDFKKVLDTGLTGALNGLVSPIQDVLNGVTSLGDGFKNVGVIVLKAIQEMIIKMLILAPIAKALQATIGSFGNPLSGAFSFGSAKGNVFTGTERFAKGGAFTNGLFTSPTAFKFASGGGFGLGEMGEAGPEAVMPLKRGSDGSLGVQMYGQRSNNDNSTSVVVAPVYHLGGTASQADLAELKKSQDQFKRELPGIVVKTTREMSRRNTRV